MSKGVFIGLVIIVCIAVIVTLVLLLIKKPFQREDVIILEKKQLSDILAIDLTNENIVLKGLKYEQKEDPVNPFSGYSTSLYSFFQVKRAYLIETPNLQLQTHEVEAIMFDWVADFLRDNFGFDEANLDYSKSLFNKYSVKQSRTSIMETDFEICLYVEKARESEDYVNCFIYTTIPDKVDFEVEKILSE